MPADFIVGGTLTFPKKPQTSYSIRTWFFSKYYVGARYIITFILHCTHQKLFKWENGTEQTHTLQKRKSLQKSWYISFTSLG